MAGSGYCTEPQFLYEILQLAGNDRPVQECAVINIPKLVLDRKLPIRIQGTTMRRAHELDPAGETLEEGIQVKAHMARVVFQGFYIIVEQLTDAQPHQGLHI
jgi:hypothetical protein